MQQRGFATYLHFETAATSKLPASIPFVGFSWPYFSQIRQSLALRLAAYPSLPLRLADLDRFGTVHTSTYLQQIRLMATDTPPASLPRLSRECSGLEYCLPGYQAAWAVCSKLLIECAPERLTAPIASAWVGITPIPIGATAIACSTHWPLLFDMHNLKGLHVC